LLNEKSFIRVVCYVGLTGQKMYPRFTRGEYWLLETAVEEPVPFSILMRPKLGEFLNKTPHGVDRDSLIADLSRLFAEELIVAESIQGERFFPGRGQIEELLNLEASSPLSIFPAFWLTVKGAALWEAFARPDWHCFISATFSSRDDSLCVDTFCGMDLGRLEWYFRSLVFMEDGQSIGPPQAEWDTIKPWKATYWKTLPSAHRVRVRLHGDMYVSYTSNGHVFEILRRGWYRWGG
jgi:hypothetical protein